MKKILVVLISLVLVLAVFSGVPSGKIGAEEKPTSIGWLFWYPEPTDFLKQYNNSQNKVKVEYENVGGNNFVQVLNTRLAAGEGPELYSIYYRELYEQQAKEKGLVDLSGETFWKSFDPMAIEQNRAADGKIYGLPTSIIVNCVFYNTEILAKYKIAPPTNWQDYMAACATLKAKGVVPQVQGMKDLWQCKYVGLNPVSAMLYKDSQWLVKLNKGEVKWTDADCLAQYRKKEEFIKKGYLMEGSISMTFQQAWQVFCEGKAAFIGGGSYFLNNVFPQLKPSFKWGVIPTPVIDKGNPVKVEYAADTTTVAINAKGKNVAKSLQFIRWFARPENMKKWTVSAQTFGPGKDPNYNFAPGAERFRSLLKMDKFKFDREPAYLATEFGKTQQEMVLGLKTAEDVVKELQAKTDLSIKK